jgi:glucuronoarabinoxylan endo-1,4-beta-xylanase
MPATQINTLYGTASGDLGLTMMRVRIAPTTWDSSTQTAGTSAWTAELGNALAAQAMGATVFATPWTPPASMKSDNSVNEGSLNAANYADFANYLEAYVNYATNQGVNLYAISMQNEPDWNPCGTGGPTASSCYESCIWTAAQMDMWVANNSSVLTTKLIMPESYSFSAAMSDPSLNDPTAVDKIAIIGGHLYGAAPSYYTLAKTLNKDVWMTEHTVNLASGETTTQSMADALSAATEVHNSMTVGQYNAYVYWWMVNSASLSYYSGLLGTDGNMTYFGAAIAQFARFVRPGYSRYNATASPASGVYISAYGGSGHSVIVAINTNASAAGQAFTIQNQTITALTPYQTTSGGMVAPQTPVTVTGNQFTYTLPAQSITTFVQ